MMYRLIIWKRMIEDLIIFPFVWWGRQKAKSVPLARQYEIFFFFPFYHTGGAEKVHTQIVQALHGRRALIVFTRRSHNKAFLSAFEAAGHDIMDISAYTDNKKRYWNNLVYRGIFSAYINEQQQRPMIFQGHSNFGYKLSRWIRKEVAQVELIHSFSSFSYIRVPFLPFYSATVMISRNRISDHLAQYRRWGIPGEMDGRIRYIQNAIELPTVGPLTPRSFEQTNLGIMYVGRGTAEKRVHLAGAIVTAARNAGLPVTCSFVGDVADAVGDDNKKHDQLFGNVDDPELLDRLYREHADILLITSSEEGFPMVVMEAMARGSIIVATPVGDIPLHIQEGENGHLFSTVEDEGKIIHEAVKFIRDLSANRDKCRRMSANNLAYAQKHFGLPTFEKQYRDLIESYLH